MLQKWYYGLSLFVLFFFFCFFFLLSSKIVKWYSYISVVTYSKKKYIYIRMWYDIYIYIYIYIHMYHITVSASWTHGVRPQSVIQHLNGIQWSWVQIPLRPTFYSFFKESDSGEYHMYEPIPLHSRGYLHKTSIKINVATDEGKQLKRNVTLNKRWNWSSYTKLALIAS